MANEHPEAKYECCKQEANRGQVEVENNANDGAGFRRCCGTRNGGVCGLRHFEVTVDPLDLRVTSLPAGATPGGP